MKKFIQNINRIIKIKRKRIKNQEELNSNLVSDNQNWINYIIFTFISIFSTLFIFSILIKIDEVISVRGEIQTVGSERPIKSPLSGEIENIHVKEGDFVKKNQKLITLNANEYTNQLEGLKENKIILKNKFDLQMDLIKKFEEAYEEKIVTFQDLTNLLLAKNELLSDITENKSQILETERLINKSKILSPEDGKVFNIIPNSKGYITSFNENLLFIVPQKYFEVKLFVPNSDIGFVKVDMPVEIRIDSYPFTQFGSIKGKIIKIGAESLPPDNLNRFSRFPILVNLEKKYLLKKNQKYKLFPGQSVTANIIVRKKRLITVASDLFGRSIDSLKKIRTKL